MDFFTPLVLSLFACALSVALESVFAGSGIKKRLAEIAVPAFAPPLWGWVVIGLLYYVVCFVVLYRLFSMADAVPGRNGGLLLMGTVMFVNAMWNYFFFRSRNLFHAFVLSLAYAVLAVALYVVLLGIDQIAAWVLLPYLLYLLYAGAFGYKTWKLNQTPKNAG